MSTERDVSTPADLLFQAGTELIHQGHHALGEAVLEVVDAFTEEACERTPERVDDNEAETRGRILEQQTGGATPWSAWSRYVTQHGTGRLGEALEAVAVSVRHSVLPGYIAMTRVSRVIETAEGHPVRTIEYEFRTAGDGRMFDDERESKP